MTVSDQEYLRNAGRDLEAMLKECYEPSYPVMQGWRPRQELRGKVMLNEWVVSIVNVTGSLS